MDNYHLIKKNGDWKFSKEKSERSIRNFERKSDAIEFAKEYMNNNGGSFKIHKEDGKIQEERTYPRSMDPIKSKG